MALFVFQAAPARARVIRVNLFSLALHRLFLCGIIPIRTGYLGDLLALHLLLYPGWRLSSH